MIRASNRRGRRRAVVEACRSGWSVGRSSDRDRLGGFAGGARRLDAPALALPGAVWFSDRLVDSKAAAARRSILTPRGASETFGGDLEAAATVYEQRWLRWIHGALVIACSAINAGSQSRTPQVRCFGSDRARAKSNCNEKHAGLFVHLLSQGVAPVAPVSNDLVTLWHRETKEDFLCH